MVCSVMTNAWYVLMIYHLDLLFHIRDASHAEFSIKALRDGACKVGIKGLLTSRISGLAALLSPSVLLLTSIRDLSAMSPE